MEIKKFDKFNESEDSQLEIGTKIESEHCNIFEELDSYLESFNVSMPWSKEEFYKKIAEAHIKEIPDYYDRLIKMEKDSE